MVTLVGALGGHHRARVDARGSVGALQSAWALDWWIGADDRWRLPAREPSVRQFLIDCAPVVQTSMRVPGGDAVQRVYGVAGDGDPIVVEVENASPAPFVVAFVADGAHAAAVDGSLVMIDNRPALLAARAPSRWAAEVGTAEVAVCSGQANTGPFAPRRNRAGRLSVAFLYPVPHRTTLRVALLDSREDVPTDLRTLPSAAEVARGWRAQVDRGMRVELPDARLADAVRAACAAALLGATSASPAATDAAAVEDWGYDAEAAAAWDRLSARQRRQAAHRALVPPPWADVERAADVGGSELLVCLRSFLVHEGAHEITLLSQLPDAWRGAPIEVHRAPTRLGPMSFAVRWHGARPALLWDGPPGVTLSAPGLDGDWSTTAASGEALLG